MSTTDKVREYLRERGVDHCRVLEFDVSSATVPLAALALGCDEARIAKTLAFNLHERAILVVAAGDVKIDNAKYKAQFAVKAKMLTPDQAVSMVGFAVGGVCPFAVPAGVLVYLDESLRRFDTIFPACGTSNSAIELTTDELEHYCSNLGGWVDVCKLQ